MAENSSDNAPFALLISLPAKPGQAEDIVEILNSEMPRVRQEEACLGFNVFVSEDEATVWISEVWESQDYHDNVHEQYDEVKSVRSRLPEFLSGPSTLYRLRPALSR